MNSVIIGRIILGAGLLLVMASGVRRTLERFSFNSAIVYPDLLSINFSLFHRKACPHSFSFSKDSSLHFEMQHLK